MKNNSVQETLTTKEQEIQQHLEESWKFNTGETPTREQLTELNKLITEETKNYAEELGWGSIEVQHKMCDLIKVIQTKEWDIKENEFIEIKYQHPLNGKQTIKCNILIKLHGEYHLKNKHGATFQIIDPERIVQISTSR